MLVAVHVLCLSAACRYIASNLLTLQICIDINVEPSALWFASSVAGNLPESFTIL